VIFPAPEIFRRWTDYPLTLALLLLNGVIFFTFFFETPEGTFASGLLEENQLVYTGSLYHEYISTEENQHHLYEWSKSLSLDHRPMMKTLGSLALKDTRFVEASEGIKIAGDQVLARRWRSLMKDFSENYQNEHLFRLGLSDKQKSLWSWITYQFSHASLMHLLSNCAFLFLLGCILEKLLGSYVMIGIYLLGGICGGWAYLWANPQSFVPMVGASASISALMAFYAVYENRSRVRYFFFLSPWAGHHGFIYLSPLLIFPLFLFSDISQILGAPQGSSAGVAYSAHVGGALCGLALGVLFRWVFGISKVVWSEEVAAVPMPISPEDE